MQYSWMPVRRVLQAVSHGSQRIVLQSIESSKAAFQATLMPHLERSVQPSSKTLIHSGRPQRSDLHVVPQHEFLGIRMEIDLLMHPLRHRIAVLLVLEPVRSYVGGTIDSFERYRLTAFRDSVLQFTIECR